jgi:hypothetical protein
MKNPVRQEGEEIEGEEDNDDTEIEDDDEDDSIELTSFEGGERPLKERPKDQGLAQRVAGLKKEITLWIVFIMACALILGIGGFLVVHNFQSKHTTGSNKQHVVTFKVGPINLKPGVVQEHLFHNVPRVENDIYVQQLRFYLVDEHDHNIPLEQVYHYYIYLAAEADQGLRTIAAVGAEAGSNNIRLPAPYVIWSQNKEQWALGCKLYNQWGLLSGANITIYVAYEITYTIVSEDEASQIAVKRNRRVEVSYYLFGASFIGDQVTQFHVTGDGGPSSAVQWSNEYEWKQSNAMIVLLQGYVQIGALNVTLTDTGPKGKTVATMITTYDKNGFILDMDRKTPSYHLSAGTRIRITTYYDNSKNYGDVVSMVQMYYATL